MTPLFDILTKTRRSPALCSTVTASAYPLQWYNNHSNRELVKRKLGIFYWLLLFDLVWIDLFSYQVFVFNLASMMIL